MLFNGADHRRGLGRCIEGGQVEDVSLSQKAVVAWGGGSIEREPIPRTGRAHTHTNATHMTPSNLSLQHISQLSHHTFTSRRGGRFGRAGGTKAPVGTEFKSRRLHQQNPEDADPATTGATEGFSDFRGAPPLKGLFEFLAYGMSILYGLFFFCSKDTSYHDLQN